MIEINKINKSYGKHKILSDVSLTIPNNHVFGLIGINGAGKSTLLRTIAGVLNVDSGSILIDSINVQASIEARKGIFFLSDDPISHIGSTASSLKDIYKTFYDFDENLYKEIISKFGLNDKGSIHTFSKGMKRQLYLALAFSSKPKYLLLDEAFDGLDPKARLAFKRILFTEMEKRDFTTIVTSQSLRELEDICDSFGILDGGNFIEKGNIGDKTEDFLKFQIAFKENTPVFPLASSDSYLIENINKIGKVFFVFIKGDPNLFEKDLEKYNPILFEKLETTFEEFFISTVNKEIKND
ncbi:MAG: ABC transporter ATP-binding protein [Acholeplasmatales bacterium]|jgi:ABC-2 type transport system ATP-binding protein|nr:ABC transporter ATP-binding protein [Acholeplasmatales bacterium]